MAFIEAVVASPADETAAAAIAARAGGKRRVLTEERTEALFERMTGALNSIAALVENAQARLPFYVETHGSQTFTGTTSGTPVALKAASQGGSIQPLAAQLVRVTGLVAVAFGTTTAEVGATTLQLGNQFSLPVPNVLASTQSSMAALVLPTCSFMLDSISQMALALSCTPGDTHNVTLALWLWGEQVPATGMVS